MSLPIPLTVRIVNANRDSYITRRLRDLTFRSVVPGGFASAQLSLDSPLSVPDLLLTYYARVIVYDARSGEVAWEGRLEDPGRAVRSDGQVWDLAAVGPSAHLRDVTRPIIYVDTHFESFVRADVVTVAGTANLGDDPSGVTEAMTLQIPAGTPVQSASPRSKVVQQYRPLMETGQMLGLISYTWDAGVTDTNYSVESICRTDGSTASGETARADNFNVAGGASGLLKIVTNWANNRNTLDLRFQRAAGGATTVAVDTVWCSFSALVIVGSRYNKSATHLLTAADYSTATITPAQVVEDLLGRLLPRFDGAGATVDTGSTVTINQLAYPDGATAEDILADLAVLEPGWYFAAWEANSAGLHRAEYQPWPTTVSYYADVTDGYEAPGSADGLYNAVSVRWLDAIASRIRMTRRTQTVPELTAAGLTREGLLDISDRSGTLADAQTAGDKWLAERLRPPNAGKLTIGRTIFDASTGRRVPPWLIRPGKLIRVRGVMPYIDALNLTDRDAVTIFRVAAVDFSSSTGQATLELDTFAPGVARQIADLQRKRVPKR